MSGTGPGFKSQMTTYYVSISISAVIISVIVKFILNKYDQNMNGYASLLISEIFGLILGGVIVFFALPVIMRKISST